MDELINVVNSKQAKTAESQKNRRKEQECRVIYQVSTLVGLGGLVLGAMWLPVLAIPVAWIMFTSAVVVADRYLRRK